MLFVYDHALAGYRLSPTHPLQPERFSLAYELLDAWGLLTSEKMSRSACDTGDRAFVRSAQAASTGDLLLAHASSYVDFVRRASRDMTLSGHGLGPGDTPVFPGMHEAASLGVGASIEAVRSVAGGECKRSCNLAGGLHHAHHDRASGFCIYNDVVVAIRVACREHPQMRIAYVDVDAHHGDGVEEAFAEEPDVLTISVHESGRFLFPGTGDTRDIGSGKGRGRAVNVPLPPYAGEASYDLACREAIVPALEAFGPDMIVLQGGADSHANDPLTHLQQTVSGYAALIAGLVSAADRLCSGRISMLGGGGYRTFDEVPRMWASAVCALLGHEVPAKLPTAWLERSGEAAARFDEPPCLVHDTLAEEQEVPPEPEGVLRETAATIQRLKAASPLLGGSAAGGFETLEEELADLVERELDTGV